MQFDFRIGEQPYKASWTNKTCEATTVHAALTLRGLLVVAAEARRLTRLRLRGRVRQARGLLIGKVIKPLLRWCGMIPNSHRTTPARA